LESRKAFYMIESEQSRRFHSLDKNVLSFKTGHISPVGNGSVYQVRFALLFFSLRSLFSLRRWIAQVSAMGHVHHF
jgi:hypothetical protein